MTDTTSRTRLTSSDGYVNANDAGFMNATASINVNPPADDGQIKLFRAGGLSNQMIFLDPEVETYQPTNKRPPTNAATLIDTSASAHPQSPLSADNLSRPRQDYSDKTRRDSQNFSDAFPHLQGEQYNAYRHYKEQNVTDGHNPATIYNSGREGETNRDPRINTSNQYQASGTEKPNPKRKKIIIGLTITMVILVAAGAIAGAVIATMGTTTPPPTLPTTTTTTTPPITTTIKTWPFEWTVTQPVRVTPAAGRCEDLVYDVCAIYYNQTGLPNIFGWEQQREGELGIIDFLDMLEIGCFEHMLEFACSAIFPECRNNVVIYPCRDFCREFVESCNYPLFCQRFPDDDDPSYCRPSPSVRRVQEESALADSDDKKSSVPSIALSCSFEDLNTCSFYQDKDDDFDFVIRNGSSPTLGTGPLVSAYGMYLLAEASGQYAWSRARLVSPQLYVDGSMCLIWVYNMNGEHMGSLKVYVKNQNDRESIVWFRGSHQGEGWKLGQVQLEEGQYQVIFEATRGLSHKADIAIDDVGTVDGTCIDTGCEDNEYSCWNGNCVLDHKVCDGVNDCGDLSEELNCVCDTDEFKCSMGLCIPLHQRCDATIQCPDGSDEWNCNTSCSLGRYKCPDGSCIMSEWVCDGDDDCDGGADELNCDKCRDDQFQCKDYTCISRDQHCDGLDHCPDASDEHNCFRVDVNGTAEKLIGDSWYMVCSDGIAFPVADSMCESAGYSYALRLDSSQASSDSESFVFYNVITATTEGLLTRFQIRSDCPSDEVLTLICQNYDCGIRTPQPQPFIIHGQSVAEGEWPWHVGVLNDGRHVCGGTLISSNHVITAAHCVVDYEGVAALTSSIRVELGSIYKTKVDGLRKTRRAAKIQIALNFTGSQFYLGADIAVITLSSSVSMKSNQRPACVSTEPEGFTQRTVCYTAGWGTTSSLSSGATETLQYAKFQLWPKEECKTSYPFTTDTHLCAGYISGYVTACIGDSGAGLICQDSKGLWKLKGIFSYVAKGCVSPGYPPVFTDTDPFLPWLGTILENRF